MPERFILYGPEEAYFLPFNRYKSDLRFDGNTDAECHIIGGDKFVRYGNRGFYVVDLKDSRRISIKEVVRTIVGPNEMQHWLRKGSELWIDDRKFLIDSVNVDENGKPVLTEEANSLMKERNLWDVVRVLGDRKTSPFYIEG